MKTEPLDITIRRAKKSDGPALGRYGVALMRQHHDFDAERFMLPTRMSSRMMEAGYRWWLLREARSKKAVVLVAERKGKPIGYAYGRLEGRDWYAYRDACGMFHDLWVDEAARSQGVGARLAEEMMQRLRELGAPRVVLSTAVKNEPAQRLFRKLGWRPTMIEMTREA